MAATARPNGGSSPNKSNSNNHNKNASSQQVTSPPDSPSKSTPTKSRNKKKNDAKRRSAATKKQQQQSPSKSDKTMNHNTELFNEDDSQKKQQEGKANLPMELPPPGPDKRTDLLMDSSEGNSNRTNDSAALTSDAPVESSIQKDDQSTSNGINHDQASIKPEASSRKSAVDTNSLRRRQRENRELREQIKLRDSQLQALSDRLKQQICKSKELEASLVGTTRACSQFEKLVQQELGARTRLETENEALNQTICKLRSQISVHERENSANNELIRVLNATLMERETEVSILKLKMTRMQTNSPASNMSQFNPPSNPSLVHKDPCKAFTMAGRSNSEFTRNSIVRSTMLAEAISSRSSTSQLTDQKLNDRDASVWANVPAELTPSKRPILLERNLPQLYEKCHKISGHLTSSPIKNQSSTPILRDRNYRTLPRSMKNPLDKSDECDLSSTIKNLISTDQADAIGVNSTPVKQPVSNCLVTNLDESNNTSRSSGNKSSTDPDSGERNNSKPRIEPELPGLPLTSQSDQPGRSKRDHNPEQDNYRISEPSDHYSTINESSAQSQAPITGSNNLTLEKTKTPPHLSARTPSSPSRLSAGFKKLFGKFRRSDSSSTESQSRGDLRSLDPPLTPTASSFQRGANRSTLVGPPSNFRVQMSPMKSINLQTDKPFAEWDTNMLVDWLTMIGLSMYANQCKRWAECGAHIMNATPAEVDKGLGITNHLHRKKLRLAISELNGDCDKITKAAAKLDYLWVARWLDDIGLPQYKEAFIDARVDGRVLNYLTVEDLVSMNVKSLLHHSSIRCGIRVLRSINFDLQLLKRRATADEIEQMNNMRASMDGKSDASEAERMDTDCYSAKTGDVSEVPLWTCHRVMEWLRMIDFAEFAPNLRGSGVHGGLIIYEDAFTIDTMSTLLSIPTGRTLLRRHLSTFFENLIGSELVERKKLYRETSSNQQLNPSSEIKNYRKSSLWFNKLKSSRGSQDGMDEYLCPMYPVEPHIIKSPTRKPDSSRREGTSLPRIPESINV